ncbi:hypothetical protein PPACK8108_LOCUS20297 [Phakopsora pachyrhizi]|uniref:Uncharacterized protein n=1 Tax=Phakopsora pachyrhizi TaxID=170000 RepID=A0AAV0BI28_PHAPC|nr:hypothetical protein PPACK8108_LOCUS20297 [Phakopsora pachyrhizi]
MNNLNGGGVTDAVNVCGQAGAQFGSAALGPGLGPEAGRGLAWQGWVLGKARAWAGRGLAWQGWVLGLVGKVGLGWVLGQVGAWLSLAGLGPGADRAGRAGRGLAGLGWAGLVGRAGRGWAGTKLRLVLQPERQAEGFWVKANERLVRDVEHVAVVEKASFKSGCDFDTEVVQGVMWH